MRFAGIQLSNFMDDANFDGISKTATTSRANERMAVDQAAGLAEQADINAEATIKSAKFGASATVAQGAAQGQSAMFGGIANGIGSVAAGFANRDKPEPTPKPSPGQPVLPAQQPLNGPSYLNPAAPTSIADYQLKLGGW